MTETRSTPFQADLKPYPKMKDSGVAWLGEVPEHWKISRGKALFRSIDVRSSSGQEELLTVSSERGVVPRRSVNVTMFKAESYVGYKLCWPGDLVINSLWAWARGLGVSRYSGIVSSAYGVYRLRPEFEDYSAFVHQLVRSAPFQWELQVRSKGIWISRLQLTDEAFLGSPFPIPLEEEQSAIVHFLSYMDRRIRRYIRAKQKLIKLLEEQKQAIIHHAVTRGLDPNIRLKASGVAWLGEVPEHWEVPRLKQCTRVISKGTTPSTEGLEILESGPVRFVKAENIAGGVITDQPPCFIDHDTNRVLKRSQLREDDVLFVIAGATLGKIAIVQPKHLPANTNQAVAFIRPKKMILAQYLSFWLHSSRVKELTWLNAVQSAQPNLSMGDLGNFLVPLPPWNEQEQIVSWLVRHIVEFDSAIPSTECEINLLREYRTRLIADVVTGKIDVREAAAGLPKEVEEPELLEDADAQADGNEKSKDLDAVSEEAET